ncbi:MAG TPA: glycosyltransferase family 9 protein [Stellaceae bacterium]|nr:glycosyltransferase family 9 protein [Stellaceae bacterium]
MAAEAGASPLRRILVIKHGALGDFVQALGPAAAIRRHHPDASITLLTTAPFVDLARRSPYFDAVWIDDRPSLSDPIGIFRLRRRLRQGRFDRVYDLQTSARSSLYFRLIGPGYRPEWSGIAAGCSHPHLNPDRDRMHTLDRQRDQLGIAGIDDVASPSVSWIETPADRFDLGGPAVLLIPGGSAHRPRKRWPIDRFAALAGLIAASGRRPVILGAIQERPLAAAIQAAAPSSLDLTGQTDLPDIAALGRLAYRSIGNDTGPMHLAVAAGSPATVLYSDASDPAITAPRGPDVTVLRREDLADLTVAEVAATLDLR